MKGFFEKHGIRILAVAAGVAVLLSILSYVSLTSSFLRNAAGVIASPFRSAAAAVESWVADRRLRYEDNAALTEENRELRQRIAELEALVRQAEADSEENARLRELLELKERRRDFRFASASVIERSSSNWAATLTLNRGTVDDVAVNDCVITSERYLVGVVSEVGYDWCTVRTVIDTDTEIGARIFRTGSIAVASGDFALMDAGRLKLTYLPSDGSIVSGDYVVTSGLGGFYPSDLVIGTVESVRSDSGRESYAILAPLAPLDTLKDVFVITDYEIVD